MSTKDFRQVIDFWIGELERYDFIQLCAKSSPDSWSLGQVYIHLIENTNYFLEQARICLSTNDNANEDASPAGKAMFINNSFPDEVLEGPPSNANTREPKNKEQLINGLVNLKDQIDEIELLISTVPFKGKTRHPGLSFFNAREWLQFAEMHFRHHLRQKRRIDEFLK